MLLGPLAVLASKVTRVSVSEHGESREIVFSLVENKSAQVSQDDQWTVAGPDAALAYVVLTDVLLHLPFVDLWEGLTVEKYLDPPDSRYSPILDSYVR